MKATELINKFKQILTLSTEEVIEEATAVEETVELTEEVAPEVENVEVDEVEEVSAEETEELVEEPKEEVIEEATEEVEEEVIEEEVEEAKEEVSEEVSEEAPVNPEFELSKEDSTEVEVEEVTELAEEGDDKEEIVEDIQEAKEEIKYASAEELAGLKAQITALEELLNNMSPKKDVPQELSAEDIKEEQDTAEGISVSPEADVVENKRPLAVKSGLKNASTKDVVWNKLFGNN